MSKEKFIYKASAVDQIIAVIVLIAILAFVGLVYFDQSTNTTTGSSAEIQSLLEEKSRLEAELERLEAESLENEG